MDKINPALPKVQATTIANDAVFQSMLSSWLEEKGFIQDIRSQIRFQLVNVLKNTALNRDTCRKLSSNKSVSKQALNIIVAEYLLRNDYQYSLSVFNAEASLTNIIPDNVLQSSNAEEPMLKSEDISNIFELLGISKTGIGKEILNLYYEQPQNNSILYCLICILSMQIPKDSYRVIENPSKNVGVSNESIPVKQIYPRMSINPLDSDKNDQNIESKHLQELTKYIKEREITEKLMKDLSKSNEKLKKGLFKLAEDYNILKNKKESSKNSLNKENLKNENCKKHTIELKNESNCLLPHCGANCRDNSAKLTDLDKKYCYLEKENIDLKIRNTSQQKEITRLAIRYNNLVNAIANCEHKLLPISTEVNIEDEAYFKVYETKNSNSKKNADLQTDELSSESLTEEIVRETWYKLRILENECNKI